MAGGRPSKLNNEMLAKAQEFLSGGWKSDLDGIATYPGLMGLALYLDIHISTVEDWDKNADKSELHGKFSVIVKKIRALKKFYLVHLGLGNQLQPRVCGIMLSRVGIVEKKPDETKIIKVEGALPPALQEVVDSVNTESASKE